ncbi:MAG: M48 family metallopeptidase [Candidatus Omnitrophota bacterium]
MRFRIIILRGLPRSQSYTKSVAGSRLKQYDKWAGKTAPFGSTALTIPLTIPSEAKGQARIRCGRLSIPPLEPQVLIRVGFIILGILMVSGCATIYNPATERKEWVFIDTKQEVSIGKYISNQVKNEFKFSDDKEATKRVEGIGKIVAASCDRKDLDYHFNVVKDKELNAFAIPGGYVYVHSGLVEAATDSELACVLGHEIGHIAARHPVKKLETGLGYQIAMSLLLGRSSQAEIARGIDIMFNLISLGYSRSDEKLADKLGVKYAYKSGFEPNGMISFLGKLQKEVDKRGPQLNIEFLRSHPNLAERINLIREEIDSLENASSSLDISTLTPKQGDKATAGEKNITPRSNYSEQSDVALKPKFCRLCKTQYPERFKFCPKHGILLTPQ